MHKYELTLPLCPPGEPFHTLQSQWLRGGLQCRLRRWFVPRKRKLFPDEAFGTPAQYVSYSNSASTYLIQCVLEAWHVVQDVVCYHGSSKIYSDYNGMCEYQLSKSEC